MEATTPLSLRRQGTEATPLTGVASELLTRHTLVPRSSIVSAFRPTFHHHPLSVSPGCYSGWIADSGEVNGDADETRAHDASDTSALDRE